MLSDQRLPGLALLLVLMLGCAPAAYKCATAECEQQSAQAETCSPAGRICKGKEVFECRGGKAVGEAVQTCAYGDCSNGACTSTCDAVAANGSYIGCEYWPVDLDNATEPQQDNLCPARYYTRKTAPVCVQNNVPLGTCDYGDTCPLPNSVCMPLERCFSDAQFAPFGIVIANPDKLEPVDVTLSNGVGMSRTIRVAAGTVAALLPQELGFPDQSLDHSAIEPKAYRLLAKRPIIAYQFNPMNNVDAFSNDASLLLPAHSFSTKYAAISYGSTGGLTRGYVTVVASSAGTTTVTVTAGGDIRPGKAVPLIRQGQSQTFRLSQYETLNLEAMPNQDLTSTRVTSDQPVGLFMGHEAVKLSEPPANDCCADHLEDQVPPESTWGDSFAIVLTPRRGTKPDLIRVMALEPATTVTFDPPAPCGPLAAGKYCDVFLRNHATIKTSKPALVAHFTVSPGSETPMPMGDPSVAFAVPLAQYRSRYDLLVPAGYNTNFFSIAFPRGSTVSLDGKPVTSDLMPIAGGTMVAANLLAQPGIHTIECSAPCGVEAGGWSRHVSYLYPGGLNLKAITIR